MRRLLLFVLFFSSCVLSQIVYGQKTNIDFIHYKLDQTLCQNKTVFHFFTGNTDSTKKNLVIQRVENNKATVIFNHWMYDGIYDIVDRNNDGYKDVTTSYHDFDFIYFFDSSTNSFKTRPVYLPSTFGLVDSAKNIYWGYRDAQYSEKYDYSILYRIDGFTPILYYKIVYITPGGYSERKDVTRIELYRFKDSSYSHPVFVREIKSKDPATFNYEKFWLENYKQLLGR